ncbi:MAG: hypothetical protein O0V67_04120 [Methanocorpusculum sp.]|nr:hypothetical protein [Methanocorpusculum sp.]
MKTINAGYTIIDRFTVGEQGFAVGESKTAPSPYVTWQYRAADPEHFFWGHYFNEKAAAYEDYRKRIDNEARDLAVNARSRQYDKTSLLCRTDKRRDEPVR